MLGCLNMLIFEPKKNPLSALELITDFILGRLSQAIINPLPRSG
jgi:hypothetical protein